MAATALMFETICPFPCDVSVSFNNTIVGCWFKMIEKKKKEKEMNKLMLDFNKLKKLWVCERVIDMMSKTYQKLGHCGWLFFKIRFKSNGDLKYEFAS